MKVAEIKVGYNGDKVVIEFANVGDPDHPTTWLISRYEAVELAAALTAVVSDEGLQPTIKVQTCSSCHRERTLDDAYDYHPIQVLTGKPLGWYSGDDGEVCPECMTRIMRGR